MPPFPRRRRARHWMLFGVVACGAFARTAPARAQGQNEGAARSLFNEGRQLLKASHYEEACGKFEAARKLFVSSGLLLNLADCHERTHRTASAWAEFGAAAEAAASAGRAGDEAEAKRRQAAIEERLSRLTVHVDRPSSDEVVKRDGDVVDRSAWDSAVPVDPGTHVITAEASGRRPWSAPVAVTEPGRTVVAIVPPLDALARSEGREPLRLARLAPPAPRAPDAATAPAEAADLERPSRGTGQRVAGGVVAGAGAAAMVASGVLALLAKSQFSTAEAETGGARVNDSANAGKLADVASLVLAGGAVVAVTGIVLWSTAASPTSGGRVAIMGGMGATLGAPIAAPARCPPGLFLWGRFE